MTALPRPAGRSRLAICTVALVAALSGSATTASAASSSGTASGPSVVASTSWVAAIARLAGAGKVTVIAPPGLQHPPDYEPKASDLLAVRNADFVLLAGYEGFATKLRDAAGGDSEVITVATTYDPAGLAASVRKLGAAMGTAPVATANARKVQAAVAKVCADLRKRLGGERQRVVAHVVAADWAMCAGFKPAGVFGPMPITPGEVKKLVALRPTVVFESRNMAGSGAALTGATSAREVQVENFPGKSLDLVAVAKANAVTIAAALAG